MNKAEAKIEETYTIMERIPSKLNKTKLLNATNSTSEEGNSTQSESTPSTEEDSGPKTINK